MRNSMLVVREFSVEGAENLHKVIEAYTKTSKFGSWRLNPNSENDMFRLDLLRGNWSSWFGKSRANGYPHNQPSANAYSNQSTSMEVRFRPYPNRIKVLLSLRIHWAYPFPFSKKDSRESFIENWSKYPLEEIEEMTKYVFDFYGVRELLDTKHEVSLDM
jgi:hypothetical protein